MDAYTFVIIGAAFAFIAILIEGAKRRTANPTPNTDYNIALINGITIKIKSITFLPRNAVQIVSENDAVYLTSITNCVLIKK